MATHLSLSDVVPALRADLNVKSPPTGTLPARPPRVTWLPEVRELYRSALRGAREGDRVMARQRLERLLAMAPGTAEAVRLKIWLDEGPAPLRPDSQFQHLLHDVQESWSEPLRPARPGWRERARAAVRGHGWALWATAGGFCVAMAVAFTPLPRITSVSALLSPAADVAVRSPAAGVIDTVLVRNGDRVAAGQALFAWSTDALQLELLDAAERFSDARQPVRDATGHTLAGASLLAELNLAQGRLPQAQARLLAEQKENAGGQSTDDGDRAERLFFAAHADVRQAEEALDALASTDTSQARDLQALGFEVKALESRLAQRIVTAGVAGVVSGLSLRPGQLLDRGQRVMQLEDRDRLAVVATLTPKQAASFQVGEPITLRFGGVSTTATVEKLTRYQLTAEIANPGGRLALGAVQVELERESVSLIGLLVR